MKEIYLTFLGLCPLVALAQTIKGRVTDEHALPVGLANVQLLNSADSTFIRGTVTAADGTFAIDTNGSDGLLKVSSVGYITTYIKMRQGNTGDIRMQTDTRTVGEVVVKGKRPQYKVTTGGITVDIQHSLLKDVGTADEVLSMLPRVQGEDGKFTVFAKGTPEIYINNKKVQDTRELKRLKSTDIKSIDILTSPGARYNAEVGAVIRIRTKKAQGEGMSVETYSNVKYNKKWTTYDEASVSYRKGGLEVSGDLTFNNGNNMEDNTLKSDIYANGNHVNIMQYVPASYWYTLPGGELKTNYDFNADNSIGFSYALNGSIYEGGNAQTQQTIQRNDKPEGQIDQFMKIRENENPQHEADLYYVGKAGKLGIDFNASWLWKKSTRDQYSFERSETLSDRTVTNHNENRSNMLAGKLVLSYPVWKGELSAGMEATRSRNHGLYNNVEDILLPSNDEMHEDNIAGFVEYKMQLADWSVGGNVRYESVNSDYYSFGKYQSEPSRTYRDWFPGLSVGWEKRGWNLQLSYRKHISRPGYQSLDSNVQYDNRYQYEGGNPLLRPTIIHDVEFDATYAWLSFTTGYTYNKDVQLYFGSLYQEGKDIMLWTNRNFDKLETYNASLTLSPKFGFYSPSLTLNYLRQKFDARSYGAPTDADKPQFEIDFRNWFAIGKTAKAMVYLHYSTGYDTGFSRYRHAFNVNARLQKSFFDDRLTAALFANDIFRTLRDRWTGYYPVSTVSKNAYGYTRYIGLSLSFTFNAVEDKYKGTGAGNAEKGRF